MRISALLLLFALLSPGAAYYVTIAGLGGTPEYEQQFTNWAMEMDRELRKPGPDVHVETLTGGSATREHVRELLLRVGSELHAEDAFALLLIGHGTFDGTNYKFNLPGPDITATDLAALLNRIPAQRQAIVNMTSASGASLAALAKRNRIVITATKSGNEKNATVFTRYWVDALRDPSADSDKNGTVSVLEAYRYAARKTAAYFDGEKLLATEHSTLNDSQLAGTFPLLMSESDTAISVAPEKRRLVAKKEQLEAEIDRLKSQKAALAADEYKQQLTALLLQLARTQAEIDR